MCGEHRQAGAYGGQFFFPFTFWVPGINPGKVPLPAGHLTTRLPALLLSSGIVSICLDTGIHHLPITPECTHTQGREGGGPQEQL